MRNNWLKENAKWLIPVVSFIGGLLLGFYLAVIRYDTSLEFIKDDIHDLKTIIQNKVLTK